MKRHRPVSGTCSRLNKSDTRRCRLGKEDNDALKEVIYNRPNTNSVDDDIASLQP